MAMEPKRMTKTQSLSLRLDPKTKFILDFMARIRGQSITTVVERAIKETASQIGVGPEQDEYGNRTGPRIWSDFWDASEGVRTLKLLAEPDYPTTYDEDELRAFTLAHWQFFHIDSSGDKPRRGFVEILWPSIDRYLQIWQEKKTENYWAAGEAMVADLSAAGVATPEWPPKTQKKSSLNAETSGDDLDDEIPF